MKVLIVVDEHGTYTEREVQWQTQLPEIGHSIDLKDLEIAKVTDIIWCFDSPDGYDVMIYADID